MDAQLATISDVMREAVDHWVEHCPRMTLNLLLKKQLGERVFSAAKEALERLCKEPVEDRDAIWEEIREDGIILPEEPLVEENPERASRIRQQIEEMIDLQFPYSKEKHRVNNALQVTGWTLERKGVRADWTPDDPNAELAEQTAQSQLPKLMRQ